MKHEWHVEYIFLGLFAKLHDTRREQGQLSVRLSELESDGYEIFQVIVHANSTYIIYRK